MRYFIILTILLFASCYREDNVFPEAHTIDNPCEEIGFVQFADRMIYCQHMNYMDSIVHFLNPNEILRYAFLYSEDERNSQILTLSFNLNPIKTEIDVYARFLDNDASICSETPYYKHIDVTEWVFDDKGCRFEFKMDCPLLGGIVNVKGVAYD